MMANNIINNDSTPIIPCSIIIYKDTAVKLGSLV